MAALFPKPNTLWLAQWPGTGSAKENLGFKATEYENRLFGTSDGPTSIIDSLLQAVSLLH